MTARWAPLLVGEDAAGAAVVARRVLDELRTLPPRDATLADGSAGLAVLFTYADHLWPGQGHGDHAMSLIEHAVEALGVEPFFPSLYGGFSGIAWAACHLGVLADQEEGIADLDEAVRTAVRLDPLSMPCELISGVIGQAVYLRERLPAPAAAAGLEEVVARVAERALWEEDRCAWLNRPTGPVSPTLRAAHPNGFFDLGQAHGMAGVLTMLAKLHERRPSPRVESLLAGAIRWISGVRLPGGERSVFPSIVDFRSRAGRSSRAAWCYGDPGLATALWSVGSCTGRQDCRDLALEMVRRAARQPDSAGVVDAGLCHGSAGLAHMFARFHQASGDEELAAAARFWYRRTIGFAGHSNGLGGFLFRTHHEWRPEPGFLDGAAGVALALIAAIDDVEPTWDRSLLLS